MAWTISSSYAGDFLADLYQVLSVGNQVVQKGLAALLTGIAKKRYLRTLSQTDDPLMAYTEDAPSSDSVTTTYSERYLEPQKVTLYEEFTPDDLLDIWPDLQAQGDLTNLRTNPTFLMKVLELYQNKVGTQVSKLVFQGDTDSATPALAYFDGIIKRAAADASVVDVANVGVITTENVGTILGNIWQAIDDKFFDDPDYLIMMSTTDYKKLQIANNNAKISTVGILDEQIRSLFLNKRIVHVSGIPENTVLAMKASSNPMTSNLFIGAWVAPDGENPIIDKTENAAKTWFVRIDWALDANYRVGSEIVMYQGS